MNFEMYLTQTIQKAVKEVIRDELDELREAIIHIIKSQNQPVRSTKFGSAGEIIRPKELADMLSLSISTIYCMYSEGQLPPKIKISSSAVGWLRSDIEEWLHGRREVMNRNMG